MEERDREHLKCINEQLDLYIDDMFAALAASSIVVVATMVGENSKSTLACRCAGNAFAVQKSLEIACDDFARTIAEREDSED